MRPHTQAYAGSSVAPSKTSAATQVHQNLVMTALRLRVHEALTRVRIRYFVTAGKRHRACTRV